jgi:hypothetical protein
MLWNWMSENADDRVVSQSCNAANASQTGALALGLEHRVNLLWTDVPVGVKRVKTLGKGLFAVRAEKR